MAQHSETIYSLADEACDRAASTDRALTLTFKGTEVTVTPTSSMRDVAEIWFWKHQWELLTGTKG